MFTRRWWLAQANPERWREGATRWLVFKTYVRVIATWPAWFVRTWFRSWFISVRYQHASGAVSGSWQGVYRGGKQELIDKYTEDWKPPFGSNLLPGGEYRLRVTARRCWPWELF